MNFHITAQRGELMSVTCSSAIELDAALEKMKMVVRDITCRTTEQIVRLADAIEGPFSVGWATRTGWIYVEKVAS